MSNIIHTDHEFDIYINTSGTVQIDIFENPSDDPEREPDDVITYTLEELAADLVINCCDDYGDLPDEHRQYIHNTIASMRDAIQILEEGLAEDDDE